MAQAYGFHARADRSQAATFAQTGAGDVKALKGAPGMRLRAGDWRVLFTVKGNTITVHAVGHRREIHD
jgi:mRNA interferase RelE/StbE